MSEYDERYDQYDRWQESVQQELARREKWVAGQESVCQDDYEWATMTGEYADDANCVYHTRSDGSIWYERFI